MLSSLGTPRLFLASKNMVVNLYDVDVDDDDDVDDDGTSTFSVFAAVAVA